VVTTVTAMIGAIPFLYYNLFLKWPGYGSISVFKQLNMANGNASLSERIYGGAVVGIPMGTGMCVPGHCEYWQLWYGALYLILILASGVMAVLGWRRVRTAGLSGQEARDERLRQLGRFGLVLAALATIASYVRSPSAGWWYNETARYLSCLVISTPALLWPLWSLVRNASRKWLRAVGVAGLATIAALASIATIAVVVDVGRLRQIGERQDTLIAALDARGITRIYSEYWTCNIVTYKANERIVCVVLDGQLALGRNRYAPYINIVAAEPRPAYVVPHQPYDGGGRSDALDKRLRELGMTAEMYTIDGYDIYLPSAEFTAQLPARKPQS
jgi:hypothetical protein